MIQTVAPEHPEKEKLMKNFYNVVGVYGAIWIIFHLTIVFFFGFVVGSPLLVGIFLGIGNLWSMAIDVPLGTIQRHVSSKSMFVVANIFMILSAAIFLYLVKTSNGLGLNFSGGILEITRTFLMTGVNSILLLIIGILYGTVKEIYDITILSYLLNHNDPSEYDKALSQSNIYSGLGMVAGVLLSIIILSLKTDSVQLILFVLIFLVVCLWVFIMNYFDNSQEVFNLETVTHLHIVEKTKNLGSKAAFLKNTVTTGDFEKLKGTMDYIIMKPKEVTKEIDWGDIFSKTKTEFVMIYRLIFEKTTFIPILLWSTGCIFIFGCWDTIVTTFFITFLDEALKNSGVDNVIRSGFILIGILALPAYLTQFFWIKKAEIYGKYQIITFGVFLSAGALFGLGIVSSFQTVIGLILVMLFGLTNSTGYAAGYPMSQSIFADEYNKAFSRVTGSNVVNADASAAPLKILNNFANAIGLIFGGALISFIGFGGMFIVYGAAVLFWGIVSITKKVEWKLEE